MLEQFIAETKGRQEKKLVNTPCAGDFKVLHTPQT